MTTEEWRAEAIQAMRDMNPDLRPDIDLLGWAMALRGNADGSAEGTEDAEVLRVAWRYLAMRVSTWRPSYSESDAHLLAFFRSVLHETARSFGEVTP